MKGVSVFDLELILGSKQVVDYTSTASVVYYGLAAPGSLTSDAVWQIRRETDDSNSRLTKLDFAGGTLAFNQIWDNRVSLVYS